MYHSFEDITQLFRMGFRYYQVVRSSCSPMSIAKFALRRKGLTIKAKTGTAILLMGIFITRFRLIFLIIHVLNIKVWGIILHHDREFLQNSCMSHRLLNTIILVQLLSYLSNTRISIFNSKFSPTSGFSCICLLLS